MFLSSCATGKFILSPTHRAVSSYNDCGKNGRCTCPNVAGIQLELEEQARLLELLLPLPKRPRAYSKCHMELDLQTMGYF